MSIISAFTPYGNTVAIVTNAGANTTSSSTIVLTGATTAFIANSLAVPPCVRVVNLGTSPVFLSFTNAARTAIIPVAGVNQLEFPVLAGAAEVFTGLPWFQVGAIAGNPPTPQMNLIVSTISAGASQPLYLTFGEGV